MKSMFIFPKVLKSILSLSPLFTFIGWIIDPDINQSPFLKVTGLSLNRVITTLKDDLTLDKHLAIIDSGIARIGGQ